MPVVYAGPKPVGGNACADQHVRKIRMNGGLNVIANGGLDVIANGGLNVIAAGAGNAIALNNQHLLG